ncbi:MAG: hypothetical protein HY686_04095 [Chloroflexi bacterium]|nr:hypothetical protein [Chloroflexota bacterium]
MPRYDYECQNCHHLFELRQGFDAPSTGVCPQCNGPAQRLFHSVGVIFKGSGWYTTDYAHRNALSSDPHRHDNGEDGKSSRARRKLSPLSPRSKLSPRPSPRSRRRARLSQGL